MKRRTFITLLGGAAAGPLTAETQQHNRVPHVGLVSVGADPSNPVVYVPFFEQITVSQIPLHVVARQQLRNLSQVPRELLDSP